MREACVTVLGLCYRIRLFEQNKIIHIDVQLNLGSRLFHFVRKDGLLIHLKIN
jgi:hypothetical protein